jgi:hypothetical protein
VIRVCNWDCACFISGKWSVWYLLVMDVGHRASYVEWECSEQCRHPSSLGAVCCSHRRHHSAHLVFHFNVSTLAAWLRQAAWLGQMMGDGTYSQPRPEVTPEVAVLRKSCANSSSDTSRYILVYCCSADRRPYCPLPTLSPGVLSCCLLARTLLLNNGQRHLHMRWCRAA